MGVPARPRVHECRPGGLERPRSPADITYITNKPLREVVAAVTALGDDGLVLFVSMQSDGEGVVRTGAEVLEALRRTATAPIYGMSRNVLGHGIVGGVLMDMERHGLDLAQRARQILAGERAADLAPMTSANLVAFDWRELRRFGVAEARLPVGATVVNRELSLWQTVPVDAFSPLVRCWSVSSC